MPASIRQKGDKTETIKHIRLAKTELHRTKDLRDKINVPVYSRTVEVNPYTTIEILLEGELEIVTITSNPPEGAEKEGGEEEKVEEERELCYPGFIVYQGNGAYHDSEQNTFGYHIYYNDAKEAWEVSDNPRPYGYTAAWFGIRRLYNRYHNKKGLTKCTLITWKGMGSGGTAYTYDYVWPSATYTDYRSPYIGIGGERYAITGEIMGACLLPGATKDYFYFLTYHRRTDILSREWGESFKMWRSERKTETFEPDMATLTLTGEYDWLDIRGQLGLVTDGSGLHFQRPGQVAFVTDQGKAFLTFAHAPPTTDDSTHIWPNQSESSWQLRFKEDDNTLVLGYRTFNLELPVIAEFDLVGGTAEFSWAYQKSATPTRTHQRYSVRKNASVVNMTGYGGIGLNTGFYGDCVAGSNDYLRVDCPGGITFKSPGEQVIRTTPEEVAYESSSTTGEEMHLTYVGGCEDKIEYRVAHEHIPDFTKHQMSSSTFPVQNPDYVEGSSIQSVPAYPSSFVTNYGGASFSTYLRRYRNDGLDWELKVLDYRQTPVTARTWRWKNSTPSSGSIHVIDQMYDSMTHFRLPSGVNDLTNNSSFTWDNPGSWRLSTTINYGHATAYLMKRSIVYQHPMIDYVSFLELEQQIVGINQIRSATLSYKIKRGDDEETRWSVAAAYAPVPVGAGILRFAPAGMYNFNNPSNDLPSPGDWTVSADLSAQIPFRVTVATVYSAGGVQYLNLDALTAGLSRLYNWTGAEYLNVAGWNSHVEPLHIKIGHPEATSPVNGYYSDFRYRTEFVAVHHKQFGPRGNDGGPPFIAFFVHPEPTDFAFSGSDEGRYNELIKMSIGQDISDSDACYIPAIDAFNIPENAEFVSNVLTPEKIQKLIEEHEPEGFDDLFPKDLFVNFGVI